VVSLVHNDEVERRGSSPASNEGSLSKSSNPSLANRRRDPRSLEPIVRMHRPELVATQAIPKTRAAIQNRAISYLREESIYHVSGSTECTRDAQLKCPFEKSIQDRFATSIRLGKEDHFAVVRNATLFTISKVYNF